MRTGCRWMGDTIGMLITEQYRQLNARLHEDRPDYGSYGHRWARQIRDVAGDGTILDYGCGKATLSRELPNVVNYDPAIPEHAAEPVPADVVVCTDVLEHVEPECLDAVLDHIKALARRTVFLVVSTRPARKTLADGRNAHLIVQHSEWWRGKFVRRWNPSHSTVLADEFAWVGNSGSCNSKKGIGVSDF